ncbi:MAG: acyltransferase family protein [Anaerolineae bacterium]
MSTHPIAVKRAMTHQAAAEAQPASSAHLWYIDNLRMVIITLVVLIHVAGTYGAAEVAWFYHEPGETNILIFVITMLLGGVGSAFTMGLLFLIAGYFTPRAYDRKGAPLFLIDRFKRLGIPLLVFEFVILQLVNYPVDALDGTAPAFGQYLVDHFRGLNTIGDGPVWFLAALLLFCIGYAVWRLAADRVSDHTQTDQRIETNPPGNWAIAAFALGLGLVTFIVRIWALVGVYYEPLHLELAHAPQYIALFIVGSVAYRRNWLVRFPDTQARLWRWIALLFVLLMLPLVVAAGAFSGELDPRGAGGLNWLSLAYSLWEGFMCVSMVIVVLIWFRQRFNHQGRLAKMMSDNCFAVYVLHPLIIVWLALALRGLQMNLSLKFLLVAPIAIALCYAVAYLIRKIPFVKGVL